MNARRLLVAAALVAALSAEPVIAGAAPHKALDAKGHVPARWNLRKPPAVAHPDVAPRLGDPGSGDVSALGGTGDGVNALSFTDFDSGDLIVVSGTAVGHAGEWDGAYFTGSLYDSCVWTANTQPVDGVQREAPRKFRAYDEAWGLWVPSVSATKRSSARFYCRTQSGEPYDISSSKTNTAKWYCSKLAWYSYKAVGGVDLDADGGYWVWPIDLVNDGETRIFAHAS